MAVAGTNGLIESLSPAVRARLTESLERVDLPLRTQLFRAGELPRYAYFLTAGIASIVSDLSTGEGVEVGLIGREGVVGSLHLLGPAMGQTRCFMQVAGACLRMDYTAFRAEFQQVAELNRLVLQQVQCEALMTGQLVACNRLHEVEERLARWLLMVADRIGSMELDLTQEFLADMLGTRRSTVTIAAGTLQRSGLIDYRRGRIKILDREGLTDAACECLPAILELYRGLYRR